MTPTFQALLGLFVSLVIHSTVGLPLLLWNAAFIFHLPPTM